MTDQLVLAIENNENIIPVVGYDMLPVKLPDGSHVPYLEYLANLIITEQNLTAVPSTYTDDFSKFNYAVHKLLEKNGMQKRPTTEQVSRYAIKIHDLVDTIYIDKMVSVAPFQYFFNLTFTTHLQEAVKKYRSFPGSNSSTTQFAFKTKNPKRPDDLQKTDCSFLAKVYNLMGPAYNDKSALLNYYYSDDDILEFISDFNKRYDVELKNYKEIILDSSLIFLGCRYPDWLTRILINTLRPSSLDSSDALIARIFYNYCNDESNAFFLTRHGFKFKHNLQCQEFITELFEKLKQTQYLISEKSDRFVFISYTRDNLSIVQKIVCQLASQTGIWFDRIKMFPGDEINKEVTDGIDNCTVFLPIITVESTTKRDTDYVRQEWKYYKNKFAAANPKVIPVVYSNLTSIQFDIDNEFGGTNIFRININDNGLSDIDINNIKDKIKNGI